MAGAPDEPRHDHRVVTALVATIVGSRQVAGSLDPEDAHELLGGAVEVMIREVDALDGTVSDLAADGILAIFGAPVAHEDDAIRGVLCGLRIVEALAEYASTLPRNQAPDGLSVRIGAESGRVVAGPIGAGSRVEYGATGDALTTATLLQSIALPNSVLVGPTTRAMAGDAFIWSGGTGYRLPHTAAQILADTALAFTPNEREQRADQEVPLVGRRAEMTMLREAAAQTTRGHGTVLVVVGDAGTGKSRLVDELHDVTLGMGSWTWLEAAAASYGQSIPLSSYRSMSLKLAGLTDNAHRQEFGPAMEALASTSSAAVAGSIRSLLRALGPDEWTTVVTRSAGGDPEAARERIFGAVCDLAAALADERPTVIVLEDLHWMDPTSVALTRVLAERCRSHPLLLMVTTRPEPEAVAEVALLQDRLGARVSRIDLRPLSREDNRALLHARLRGGRIPLRVEEHLLDTTDGNPYFLLEQVRGLVEGGALTSSTEGLQFVEGRQVELAPTLEQALIARIDRLSPEDRRTVVAASVLGLQFDGALIDELIGGNATESLRRLVDSDFLVVVDQGGDAGRWLRFQHALVRQAAYGGALKRERRSLHLRAAAALEASYAGRAAEIAPILGRHLSEAGEVHRAVPFLLRAARSAGATYSNEEAATLAHEALALLGATVRDDDRDAAMELARIETAATRQLARYDSAVAAQRRLMSFIPASDAVGRARESAVLASLLVDDHRYDEALTALQAAESSLGELPLEGGVFDVWLTINLTRGDIYYWLADDARIAELLTRVAPVVEEGATPQQKLAFKRMKRSALMRRDRFVISDEALQLDSEVYLAEVSHEDDAIRSWAPFRHAFTLMWHRDLEEAARLFRESLVEADRNGSVMLRARSLAYLMVTERLRGDAGAADELLEPVRESAREARLMEYDAMAAATASWIAYRKGDSAAVLVEGHQALALWSAMPTRYQFDWMCCLPLMAIAADDGDLPRAAHWARSMLSTEQQPLPDDVSEPLRTAVRATQARRRTAAIEAFEAALTSAQARGYL